jgi:hypothetical protein
MQPDLENFEQRSDRERRERERELLALLLLLFDETRLNVYSALRVDSDPFAAAANVILGNPRVHQPGLPNRMARILADASADGLHRAELVVGTGLQGGFTDDPTWLALAQQYAVQMLGTFNRRIRDALATARNARGGAQDAVRGAMRTWGYAEDGPHGAWLLNSVSVTWAGNAYNQGQLRGWLHPDSGVKLFRYFSILDARTSDICIAYDRVTLPMTHVWWRSHWPTNHPACRSMIYPMFIEADVTPEAMIPWAPLPVMGYGRMPTVYVPTTSTDRQYTINPARYRGLVPAAA